jgi:excisionase family DNA binding protein
MEEYYTPDEVAKLFKVTRQTVYRWIRNNTIDSIRIGASVRIPAAAVTKQEVSDDN